MNFNYFIATNCTFDLQFGAIWDETGNANGKIAAQRRDIDGSQLVAAQLLD